LNARLSVCGVSESCTRWASGRCRWCLVRSEIPGWRRAPGARRSPLRSGHTATGLLRAPQTELYCALRGWPRVHSCAPRCRRGPQAPHSTLTTHVTSGLWTGVEAAAERARLDSSRTRNTRRTKTRSSRLLPSHARALYDICTRGHTHRSTDRLNVSSEPLSPHRGSGRSRDATRCLKRSFARHLSMVPR